MGVFYQQRTWKSHGCRITDETVPVEESPLLDWAWGRVWRGWKWCRWTLHTERYVVGASVAGGQLVNVVAKAEREEAARQRRRGVWVAREPWLDGLTDQAFEFYVQGWEQEKREADRARELERRRVAAERERARAQEAEIRAEAKRKRKRARSAGRGVERAEKAPENASAVAAVEREDYRQAVLGIVREADGQLLRSAVAARFDKAAGAGDGKMAKTGERVVAAMVEKGLLRLGEGRYPKVWLAETGTVDDGRTDT